LADPPLELDLLGTRFSIAAPGRWTALLRYFWSEFERGPSPDALPVRIREGDDGTRLQLPGEPELPFEDPWGLVEVVRYWLVEHSVRRAQGVLPFHAAALTRDESGVLFAGPSGAGKTTLSVELADAGWTLSGDDIAPIDLADGRIHPFPKPLSLRRPGRWREVVRPPGDWPMPPPEGPVLVPAAFFARRSEPFEPTNLLFISYAPGAEPEREALSAGRATALCVEYARASGEASVAALARLCRSVPAARLRYPSTAAALDLVERELGVTRNDPKTG
jgi:hypothetical protein